MKKTYIYDKKLKKIVELKEKRDPGPKIHIIPDLQEYWDDNMGHEPVYVKSRRHKMELLKERRLGIK